MFPSVRLRMPLDRLGLKELDAFEGRFRAEVERVRQGATARLRARGALAHRARSG